MNPVAEIALIVNALVLAAVAPLEMFFVDRPAVHRFLGTDFSSVRDVELWSFCIGFRNLLASLGVVVGVWLLHTGSTDTGRVVMMTTAAYMLLSGLAMGIADLLGKWRPRGGSVKGVLGSSVLPAVALLVQGAWA